MPTPPDPPAAPPEPLRVLKVADVPPEPKGQSDWLVEHLWAHQAVGVLGGSPKSCKTYLALEIALAVATGTPCLGRFHVPEPGPVLLFAAEDTPVNIRARLRDLAQVRSVDFDALPVFLILTDQLRLDLKPDLERLVHAIHARQPRLLILDPFVRMHRLQENSAQEISGLLADLRALQRRFGLAVLLVHHTRKTNGQASGQDLRGSGDLHAWGDTNLYLHRRQDLLRLTVEHRAAAAPEPVDLALHGQEPAHLVVDDTPPQRRHFDPLDQQVIDTLHPHPTSMTQAQLRDLLKVRNQSLTATLHQLRDNGHIARSSHGWHLTT